MAHQDKQSTPTFTGLTWCHEQYFSFFIPIDWRKVDRPDGKQGVIYAPDQNDAHTLFAVQVDDLGTEVTSADLPYLLEGFLGGIRQLPESQIENRTDSAVATLVELEAKYTFLEEGQRRKRWVRVLYHRSRQVTFTAQGGTEKTYHYWLPMFNEAMMTLKVHSTRPTIPG